MLQQLQQQGRALQAAIEPVSSAHYRQLYPQAAARPFNSRLALAKVEQHFGLQLPDWQSQLTASVVALPAGVLTCIANL